jgi:hypothetical protein
MVGRIMVSVGAGVMTLSIGALASGYPNQIAAHWKWLVLAAIAGMLMAIWGYMLRPKDASDKSPKTTLGPNSPIGGSGTTTGGDGGNSTGGNNNGIQSQGPLVIGDSAIDKIFPDRKPPLQKQPILPNIVSLSIRQVGAQVDNLHWVKSSEGVLLYVLPIENEVRDQNAEAISVCASISLKSEPFSARVQKAFWLDREGHDIKMPISHIEHIILGRYDQGEWFFYENLCQFSRMVSDFPSTRPKEKLEHKSLPPSVWRYRSRSKSIF